MFFLIPFLLITIIFFVQDKLLKNEELLKVSLIRLISNILIGSILIYLTTLFKATRSLNTILIVSSILLLINAFINMRLYKNKLLIDMSKIIFIVLLLELSIFNYKHYLTIFNKPIEVDNYQLEHINRTEEGLIPEGTSLGSIVIPTNELKVNNLFLSIYNKNNKLLTYIVEVYDLESNKYVYLNTVTSYRGVVSSYYKTFHNTYKTDKIKITLVDDDESIYIINSIKLNPVTPVIISYFRIALLLGFIFLFKVLNTKQLFKIKVSSNNKVVKRVLILFSTTIICLVFILTNMNTAFQGNKYYSLLHGLTSINEYQELAKSLAKGKLYLDIEPSETLSNIDNPYNYEERKEAFSGEDYFLWDAAYYNNHYYVYFGIVPVLFTYLPFYLLTGNNLNNNVVVFIGLVGIILNLVFLLKRLVNKYFKETSLGTFLLLLSLIIIGNHFVVLYAAKRPDFYSIPIVWGTMFTLIGLNLWLSSIKDNKVNKLNLFLGSLSMALVAGCRPQLLLVSFSSIIILYGYIKKKNIFKKETIKEVLCFVIPYIVIAILLMLYNYLRFGSPFDFGANYNLTTNDMTVRGFNIERIGLGLYYYLLAIPRGINTFPFFEMVPLSTSYIGTTIYESMYGGLLMLYPILWLNIFIFKFKKIFKSKLLYRLSLLFIISSIVIIIADTNMAGILPRYYLDFTWMLFLSTTFIILYIYEHYKENNKVIDYLNKGLLIIVMISIIINFFMLFIDTSFSYRKVIPTIFYNFYYLIQFWL